MDLNTGTPIPQPSSQMPPMPQQSQGLPTMSGLPPLPSTEVTTPESQAMAPLQETAVPTPIVAPQSEQLPAVTPNFPAPPVEQPSQPQSFMDPLAMLKQMTSKDTSPGVSQPPLSSAPVVEEVVGTQPVMSTPAPSVDSYPTQSSPLPPAITTEKPVATIPLDALPTIQQLLDLVVEKEASDLHLVVGYAPMLRIDGELVLVGNQLLTPQTAKEIIYTILPDDKKEQLEVNREVDLAYQHANGRFRINAYWQRGYISAAYRLIPTRIRSIDEMKLPDIFHRFSDMEQGLVLVTGPTGHGKSTSLASVIQEINMKYPKHILTIEDPIEYVFPQQKALVSQRELGDDTHSWKGALRSALREDPDVVLVGEMRDLETISAALTVAETGHLVFATLHTNSAAQTIQRIVNMYPDVQQDEVRTELADVLEVVVAQRLIPVKGGGRRAALEVMLMTPAIRNLIRENKIFQIDNVIRTSLDIGMITLERSLLGLYKEGLIVQEDALRYALDPTEMARLLEELV
jgi:twitching motility protein PilT